MLHPDVLRTLAEAGACRSPQRASVSTTGTGPIHWRRPGLLGARRLVGSLLMWSGERLIGEERNALGLVPECSREAL